MNVSRNGDESTNSGQSDGKPWWELERSWVTDRARYAELVECAKRMFPSAILSSALAELLEADRAAFEARKREAQQ